MMLISFQIISQFLGGAILFYLLCSKLSRLSKILQKYFANDQNKVYYTKMIIRLILGMAAAYLFLDPLISGKPTIHVHAPTKYPAVIENLCVRIAPIKFEGNIDPARISNNMFTRESIVTKIVAMNVMEQYIHLKLYDVTQPDCPLAIRVVYISPYIRLKFWDKHIYF